MSPKRRLYLARLVSAVALVACGCFIFGFSAQPGSESGGLSAKAAGALVAVGDLLTGASTTGAALDAAVEALQWPIRKVAHMTEYAVFAVLALTQLRLWPLFNKRVALTSQASGCSIEENASQAYGRDDESEGQGLAQSPTAPATSTHKASRTPSEDSDSKLRRSVGVAWCFAVIYAATDEAHQLFVAGRTGQFTDVLIDATGAAIGLLIAVAVISIRRRRQESKQAAV